MVEEVEEDAKDSDHGEAVAEGTLSVASDEGGDKKSKKQLEKEEEEGRRLQGEEVEEGQGPGHRRCR